MAKLYPPNIEGKLPAQSGTVLRIPFRLNRSVGINEVDCVIARIKTVSTSSWKGTLPEIKVPEDAYVNYTYDIKTQSYYVEIPTETLGLTIGQYYKIQLAFYNKIGGLGYFSSVGVFKYSAIPNVYILSLDKNNRNANRYSYVGVYSQKDRDPTEKIYSYCFEIKDIKTDKIVASSGVQLHNSSEDNLSYESRDEFVLEEELQVGTLYQITYKTISMNNLEAEISYYIQRTDVIFEPLDGVLIAENDYENGCVNLKAVLNESEEDFVENRGFIISRASSKDNFEIWTDLFKFTVSSYTNFPEEIGKDFTTEQGIYYQYAIQRYQKSGIRTARLIIDEPLLSDFEDVFLFDKYRQLKIRFNTKVSSFKSTILETKIDTLGGKYPFIFRNGTIEYKEFPISGLISYLTDNDELFMSNAELGFFEENSIRMATNGSDFRFRVRSTQVDTQNILAERNFKMSVLDWLTNGEAKLFRSPSEGNYIVRLMNVSLTPNDTVGRMLHTFNGTAYEIAEYNHANLIKYGFIEEKEKVDNYLTYSSIELTPKMTGTKISFYELGGANWCLIREAPVGTRLKLNFMDGKGDVDIVIGTTGTYEVNIYDYPLISIEIIDTPSGNGLKGYIDYAYKSKLEIDDFSPIRNVIFSSEWGQSFGEVDNAFATIENVKNSILGFNYLEIQLKEGATKDSEIPILENGNYKLTMGAEIGAFMATNQFTPGTQYYILSEIKMDEEGNTVYKEIDTLLSQMTMNGIYFYKKIAQGHYIYTRALSYNSTAEYYTPEYDYQGNIIYDNNGQVIFKLATVTNETQLKNGHYYTRVYEKEKAYKPIEKYDDKLTYYTLRKNTSGQPEYFLTNVTETVFNERNQVYFAYVSIEDDEPVYIPIVTYDSNVEYYQLDEKSLEFIPAPHITSQQALDGTNYYIKKETGLEEYSPDTIYTIYTYADRITSDTNANGEKQQTQVQDIFKNNIYVPFRNPVTEELWYEKQVKEKPYADGRDIDIRYDDIDYGLKIAFEGLGTQEMDLEHQKRISWTSLPKVTSLQMDNGLYATYNYEMQEYVYGLEEDDPVIAGLKETWVFAQEELDRLKASEDIPIEDIQAQESEVFRTKTEFLTALKKALAQ